MRIEDYLVPVSIILAVFALVWVNYVDIKLRSQDYQTCLTLHAASVNEGATPPFCVRGE